MAYGDNKTIVRLPGELPWFETTVDGIYPNQRISQQVEYVLPAPTTLFNHDVCSSLRRIELLLVQLIQRPGARHSGPTAGDIERAMTSALKDHGSYR